MVIVNYGDKKAYMDGYMVDNLNLYNKMVAKSRDLIFIVTGREREGKSVLGNSILKYLDPTYNIDRCCFSGEEFLEAIKKAKQFQAVCWDEAQSFTSRASLSRMNKILVQALSMIGMKQLYVAIILPSFFELDKYPAIHRSNFLLRVYSHQMTRGFFEFWNWEKKKNLYLYGKKNYNYLCVKPNFRGRFVDKAFPFREEYEAKKLKAIEGMTIFDDGKITRSLIQRNYFIKYLHEIVGLEKEEIAEILKNTGAALTSQTIRGIITEMKEHPANASL